MKKVVRNLMLLNVAIAMFTACGKESEVTVIQAAFSVSDSKQVYFSQGNLQYKPKKNIWRFAKHQFDIIGKDNKKISKKYNDWIDLFGWGTSGYNGKNPYMTSSDFSDYGDEETNYDWGVYNKISNGGNQTGQWRTLTHDEWKYLRYDRTNADALYATAMVNGVNGCIFLPDNWTLPDGLTFTSGVANDYSSEYYKTVNNYSAKEWAKMEANGAVFLPAAGYRYGAEVFDVGSDGHYWSISAFDDNGAYCLRFDSGYVGTSSDGRYGGHSVRLVQDVQ